MKKIHTFLCLIIMFLGMMQGYTQVPTKVWDKTFGGSLHNNANSVVPTSDGGFVIAGASSSGITGDKTEASRGVNDFWIVKVNSLGQKVWDKTIGGSSDDYVSSIITTNDGGFVIAGHSSSGISGDKTEANKGNPDYWIVKLNNLGQKVWDKTIGGSGTDRTYSVTSSSDGGFVIAGTSNSVVSADKTEPSRGGDDYWIVKLNSLGQKVWDKTIGSSGTDNCTSIATSSDGGFVITGTSNSESSGDKSEANKGVYDYWIVKLNSLGQKVWDKTIGGSSNDFCYSITANSDGGFVVAGTSDSGISGDKSEANKGVYDYWIVKLNSLGQKVWDKTIGGVNYDIPSSIITSNDEGFIVLGRSESGISGDKTQAGNGGSDYWLVKLNNLGQKIWDKSFGGSSNDYPASIAFTNANEYILTGTSSSPISGDKTEANKGFSDYWIVKLQGTATSFDTAISGNWNVTSTWTCNCIPNGTLPVRIMNANIVTIPNAYIGQAKGLRFMSTGKVTLQGTGTVNVVN